MLNKLLHEFKQVATVTLYFLVCFALVFTLKKLFLAQYEIEFFGVSAAIVGALVVGKVVVVLDHTPLGKRFDEGHALWRGVAYKTATYTAITFLVVLAEKVFHAYREEGGLGSALSHVWEHRDRNAMLATVLCIGLAFAGYNVFSAIDRRLGEGTLKRLLFRRPQESGTP